MRCPLLVPHGTIDNPDAMSGLAIEFASEADALVLDLGDAAALHPRDVARRRVLKLLTEVSARARRPLLVVRVAVLSTGLTDADLDVVMSGAPDAIWLPGVVGGQSVQHLAAKLAVREAEAGLPSGSTRIVAVAADTARGALSLQTIPGASPRLMALGWDPVALAAEAGAGQERNAAPCRTARGLLLLAAAAAGVPAIDAPSPRGPKILARDCAAACRDGFSGKLALDTDQARVIGATWIPRGG